MKMDIRFEEKSLSGLQRALRIAPEKTVKGVRNWVNRTAARAERQAVLEAPVQKGQLEGSIHTKFAVQGLEAIVQPNAKHALYVHEGTGIYGPKKRPITAKNGKVLSWVGSSGRVFARSVKGQRPNKFMDRAYKSVKPEAERDAIKTLDQIVGSI